MRSDHRVIAACLAILACLAAMFFLVDRTHVAADGEEPSDSVAKSHANAPQRHYAVSERTERRLQPFDPNTADSTLLLSLGLPEWTVRAVYRYRGRGGVYSTPEDFARTYGVTVGMYKALKPYIHISGDFLPASTLVGDSRREHRDTSSRRTEYVDKLAQGERISVNDADTNALKRVPGLGSYYARRIVELRSRYGGFVSLDQLTDIKGMPEQALEYLAIPDGGIRKINVNKATFAEMQSHPYIGYTRAKAITDYRRLKGSITSLSQLSLMKGFDDAERSRLEPYIEY